MRASLQNESTDTATLLQNLALQIPAQFSVLEFLGEGGHGIVLKAKDTLLDKIVALKLIKTDRSDDAERQVRRMQNEARILGKLDHPNIVRVFQMGLCQDQTPFLVCEYLEGETLADYLCKNPQMGPKAIAEIFTQILDALDCAHAHELLHRDVKPGNIMIMRDSTNQSLDLKLLDFGIAKPLSNEEVTVVGLTRTIQMSGSAPYMSPEQCRGEKIDIRSDIYSAACVLFECLTGQPPFVGETPVLTRYMHINEKLEIPGSVTLAEPGKSAVLRLVQRALSKDAGLRPASAAEFKRELLQVLAPAIANNDWKKKSSWRLYFVLSAALLLPLLAWWISNGTKRIENLSVAGKHAGTVSGAMNKAVSSRRSTSKLARMRDIFDRYSNYHPENSENGVLEGVQLVADINVFLENLKDRNDDEKGMRFAASYIKAYTLESAGLYEEAFRAWMDVLKLCKDSKGAVTAESLTCYARLSALSSALKHYADAEMYAKKGLSSKVLDTDFVRKLYVPHAFDLREDPSFYSCYESLAYVYGIEKKYEEQLDCLKKAESERCRNERFEGSQIVAVHIAETFEKLGKHKEAIEYMQERQAALRKTFNVDRAGDFTHSMVDIGKWYRGAGLTAEAKECFDTAKRWVKFMPFNHKRDPFLEELKTRSEL